MTDLRGLGLGGNHTNVFLRQVNSQVLCQVDGLGEVGSPLNSELLAVGRSQFADALQNDLEWTVLHQDCARAFAKCDSQLGLEAFEQGALNVEVATGQSEVEVMLRMAQQAEAVPTGSQANWDIIEKSAVHSKPVCNRG